MTTTAGTAAADARHRSRPGVVAAFAITQTAGYGVLYYTFGVLLGPMSTGLGIHPAAAATALTIAVLVAGTMSIPVGRWLDRRGGHALMTAGSVLGVLAVLGWSRVTGPLELYAVFVLLGVAYSMVLYEPAFAVVVSVTDPARRANALLTVTLVGGLASTIFMPLTGRLAAAYGWRGALQILAVAYGALAIPLHALALRGTTPAARIDPAALHDRTARDRGTVARVLRDRGFWLLTAAFVLQGGALAVVAVHLVLYLTGAGHPPAVAATLAGLLGLLSVTGRVVVSLLRRWLPMAAIAAGVFVVQATALAAMPAASGSVAGAAACIVAVGLGFGVAAIATPAILLERYGATRYGTVAGTLAAPVIVARATAPAAAAVLASATGYRTTLVTTAVLILLAAACLRRLRHHPPTGCR
ncbi:MAG TPA: MFS transporter [Kribbellaceae bacterium]